MGTLPVNALWLRKTCLIKVLFEKLGISPVKSFHPNLSNSNSGKVEKSGNSPLKLFSSKTSTNNLLKFKLAKLPDRLLLGSSNLRTSQAPFIRVTPNQVDTGCVKSQELVQLSPSVVW